MATGFVCHCLISMHPSCCISSPATVPWCMSQSPLPTSSAVKLLQPQGTLILPQSLLGSWSSSAMSWGASSRTDLRYPRASQLWMGRGKGGITKHHTCTSKEHTYNPSAAALIMGLRSIGICFPSLFRWVFRFWGRELAFQLRGFLSGNRTVPEKSLQGSGEQANTLSREGEEQTTSLLLHSSYSIHSMQLQTAAYGATLSKPFNFFYTSF